MGAESSIISLPGWTPAEVKKSGSANQFNKLASASSRFLPSDGSARFRLATIGDVLVLLKAHDNFDADADRARQFPRQSLLAINLLLPRSVRNLLHQHRRHSSGAAPRIVLDFPIGFGIWPSTE
jgi:hypothetical protein